jgi:potassium-dependent mechanosensitive channel
MIRPTKSIPMPISRLSHELRPRGTSDPVTSQRDRALRRSRLSVIPQSGSSRTQSGIGKSMSPLIYGILSAMLWLSVGCRLIAAQPTPVPSPSASASPSAAPSATPAPIPLSETAWQSESVLNQLNALADATDTSTGIVAKHLSPFSIEITSRIIENNQILTANPPLELLQTLQSSWTNAHQTLSDWDRALAKSGSDYESKLKQLDSLTTTWETTRNLAQTEHAPPEIVQRIQQVLKKIRTTRPTLASQLKQVLSMQDRVAEQSARVAAALDSVRRSRQQALSRLFTRDSPPIWQEESAYELQHSLTQKTVSSVSNQWETLASYVTRERVRFYFHGILILFLFFLLRWAKTQAIAWAKEDTSFEKVANVFALPAANAFTLCILVSHWFYPEAPRILYAIIGAITIFPAVLVLRRLITRSVLPILYALLVFYFLDQFRDISASLRDVTRWVFILEMFGCISFLAWLLWLGRKREEKPLYRKLKQAIGALAFGLFTIGIATNFFGYVGLAYIIGNTILFSAYAAIFLAAAARIIDGLVVVALKVRPLRLLRAVRNHWQMLHRRILKIIRFAAWIWWIDIVLQRCTLAWPITYAIRQTLSGSTSIGTVTISVGNIVAFIVTMWATFLISRFIRFLLEEDVYYLFTLPRGVPYAISTVSNYIILLIGFFLALAALGIDMTKFTILAGAFSVGVGFGLQNVINNFVSGLILLFERPIKVGDIIQVASNTGAVQRIGIRASIIRTTDGSEIIVPNGKLISEDVTNWTFSDRRRAIQIPVTTVRTADPEKVIELIKRIASANDKIAQQPAPQVYFSNATATDLNFELRAWTEHYEEWASIKSDLSLAINDSLAKENLGN